MLTRLFAGVSVASMLLAQAPAPGGQAADGQEPPRIRVQVNEVIVPVTVTDYKDRFVNNLDVNDFHIYDQGREQKIVYFSRERSQPVVVGFLLDMSNPTRLHWKTFQEAALDLVFNLLPGDKRFSGYLITYGNEAELAINTTNDSEKIADKIRKLDMGAVEHIKALDSEGLLKYCDRTGATICGQVPITLLLKVLSGSPGVQGFSLHYATSAQVTGDYGDSVSYYAHAFYRAAAPPKK